MDYEWDKKTIKYKDQLNKELKGTAQSDPSYELRKQNLSLYNKIIKFCKRSNDALL